jgi:hypothetical protein
LLMPADTHVSCVTPTSIAENAVVPLISTKTCTRTAIILQLITVHTVLWWRWRWHYFASAARSPCSSCSMSEQSVQRVTGGTFGRTDVTCLPYAFCGLCIMQMSAGFESCDVTSIGEP